MFHFNEFDFRNCTIIVGNNKQNYNIQTFFLTNFYIFLWPWAAALGPLIHRSQYKNSLLIKGHTEPGLPTLKSSRNFLKFVPKQDLRYRYVYTGTLDTLRDFNAWNTAICCPSMIGKESSISQLRPQESKQNCR